MYPLGMRGLHRFKLVVSTAGFFALGGCGGDDGGPKGDCAVSFGEVAETAFATPDQMNLEGCQPGTLAGFNPSGFWYVEEERMPLFSGGGPVRIESQCDDGGDSGLSVAQSGIASTVMPNYAQFDDDYMFWRRERTFNNGELLFVTAFNACKLNPDGTLFGRSVRCFISEQGQDCDERAFDMSIFGRLDGENEADGLSLVSEFGGPAGTPWPAEEFTANVRVESGVAYLVRSDGLRILDVSDTSAPTQLGEFLVNDGESFNDVKIATGPGPATYAIVASNARGAVVLDVSTPTTPTLVTTFTPANEEGHGIHSLFTETVADETRAYLADGFSNLLAIFDITDPSAPTSIGGLTLATDPGIHDLYVTNGVIYANATETGLVIADSLSTPSDPTVLATIPSAPGYSHSNWVTTAGGRTISVTGDEGYGAFASIVDVDPVSPQFGQEIGQFKLRDKVSIHNIMAFENRAYIAHYQDGVRILDLSDPTSPTQIAYFNTWDPANAQGAKFEGAAGIDVDLSEKLIYVADSRGLLILSIDLE